MNIEAQLRTKRSRRPRGRIRRSRPPSACASDEIQTPCLILDLDALERNIRKMGDYARAHNMRHRAHGKMHKSVDVLRLQQKLGGAIGVCCQKVSEAEVFARAGINDILVSNEVRDPAKIDRLARLPQLWRAYHRLRRRPRQRRRTLRRRAEARHDA